MKYQLKNDGYSLIELIIGCTIFSLVLLLFCFIFKNSWDTFRQGDVARDQLRKSGTIMNNFYRELRLSEEIYHPTEASFTENDFKNQGNLLVFNLINAGTKIVNGYKLTNYRLNDEINKYVYDLCKITYDPYFDPGVSETVVGQPRVLSSYVTVFLVSRDLATSTLTIKLEVASKYKDKPNFQVVCKMPIKKVIEFE